MKVLIKILFFSFCVSIATRAQSLTENQLLEVRFDQKLDSQISLQTTFRDERGKTVSLGDYFGKKPVVLVLGYYQCPMLCTLTFNGMVESMEDLKWSIGKEFNVVLVSINPKENPELAAAKKQTYLKRYGRADAAAGWHFLTGDEANIQKLADEVGFHYAYDRSVQQYAHPAGLVIVTPEGKVSKYFFGVTFSPTDLYAGLQGASENKVGSPIERLILLCFHYSPIQGKYGPLIMTAVRILGAVTIVGFSWFFIAMIRREKKQRAGFLLSKIRVPLPPPADIPHDA